MILRELLLKLGLDVDAQSFAKGKLAADVVEAAMRRIVDAAVDVARAFVENVQGVAEYGEEIEGLAQSTGIGIASLQRLAKAAATEGVGLEEFSHSMVLLSRTMIAAKDGQEEAAGAFQKAGVKVTDAAGKVRPAEDVFIDIADHFANMQDGAEKTALSLKLFGRSGAGMIEILNKGRAELEQFMQAAVMPDEQIQAAKEIIDTQRLLAMQTKGLWREAIGPLLPAIRDLLKRYYEWKKANAELIKGKIREWARLGIKAIEKLGDAFEFLVRNAETVKGVLAGLVLGMIALKISASEAGLATLLAWTRALAPFAALAAAIAGIMIFFDDVRVYRRSLEDPNFKGKSIIGQWAQTIAEWQKPNANDPWWLKAIKQLVIYMEKALGIAKGLGIAGEEAAGGGRRRDSYRDEETGVEAHDPLTGRRLPLPFIRGKPLESQSPNGYSARFERAMEATGSRWEGLKAGFGFGPYAAATPPPEAMPAQGRNYSIVPQLTLNMSVATQPGQDNQSIVQGLYEKIRAERDAEYEAAYAAVSE